jgi:hypothetical protein
MNYSINSLNTVADCDVSLDFANAERSALDLKLRNLSSLLVTYSETSVNVESEIQALTAEIAAIDSYIDLLPDTKQKNLTITKRKKSDARLSALLDKKGNYGLIALLNKQLDYNQIEVQITQVDDFITQVEARKATL